MFVTGLICLAIAFIISLSCELLFQNTYVLLRLYELDETDENLVHDITYATNSQNPVDLRDLRANDTIQQKVDRKNVARKIEYFFRKAGSSKFRSSKKYARSFYS
jgi:hypothetical protein